MKSVKLDERNERSCTDITDKLQAYMQSLQFFDDDIDDYIYIYDLTAERVYFTDKIRERFPIPPATENGNKFSDWNDIVYSKDREFMDYYRNLLIEEKIKSFSIVHRIVDKKGDKVWVNVKGTMREKENKQSLLVVGRISEMALGCVVDSLTGLCGMEKFMEDLKQYLKTDAGYLMILGIDNFKNINITQGRSFGDDILKKVTEILDQHSDYPINLYRLDGDCFAVVFPNKQQEDVVEFYDSIKKAMKNVCTVSAGIVHYTNSDTVDSGMVYQYAENALDQAKREGKNRMVFFSEDNYQKNLEQVGLLEEMSECIKENCKGFFLLYQPQIDSQNYTICGVEALLRFRSSSRGKIGPAKFIPLLEQSRLICPVGEWVLKTAIYQCKEWRKIIPDFHISVNISYVQLLQENIIDIVLNLIKEAELPGEALTLEVTESIPLHDYRYFNKIFYAWKEYGIKIAIDDFGTGYSSLSYLKSIEIDEVKIDRCFVNRIQYNAYNYRLLSNMIELAHSEKIRVCCEGVETEEELMVLQRLNVDFQQGYLFAKPYSKKELEQTYFQTESKAYLDRKKKEENFRQIESSESREFLEVFKKEEIVSIVENMDEMIYVSDVDTYDLYYLNAAGRRMTGVYDYKGCKCYQVLQGRNAPCEFCTNIHLHEDEFYVWEMENAFLGRHYMLKDKLIPWQGKIARMEMAIDITHKEIISNSIKRKLKLEKAIVEFCKILASENQSDKCGYNVVKIIGEFYQADRAYILMPNKNNNLWNISYEWCAERVDSAKNRFPMALEQMNKKNSDHMINVPIKKEDKLIGLVRVENLCYEEAGCEFVKTMAYFIGHYILEKENNK